jgi:hypothetical protein
MLWTAVGIGGIWVAVLLLSLLAPDMVTGSQQEHLPIAAFTTWFWGAAGTLVLLWAMGRLRGRAVWQPIWVGLSVATLGIWAVATILGITLPVMVTGTDPTRIPFAAILVPIAAAGLTALAGGVATVVRGGLGWLARPVRRRGIDRRVGARRCGWWCRCTIRGSRTVPA